MASHADVRRCLGELDDEKVAEILKLDPTLAEIELAAICIDGRTDILTRSGRQLPTTAAQILQVVLSDEEAFEPDPSV